MAERVGTRGGAVRPNKTGLASPGGSISTPSAGGGASVAWGILARGTGELAEVAHRRYDAQVAVKSHEAGVMDAIMGRVRRLDRSTTRGGAYMDAALSTSALMAETDAMEAMSDLYRQHASDPAALQSAIQDYTEGSVGELLGVDPETALQLRERIVRQSIPMINGAIENREVEMAKLKKDAIERAEAEQEMVIARNSRGVFSNDPEQRAASLSAVLDAQDKVRGFQAEDAADGFLLSRLSNGHDASHIVNMQPTLKSRLAAMIDAAPDGIRDGLGIGSGYRSVQRQAELFAQSDRSGKRVARPGHSQHNHGNAADLTFNGQFLGKAPKNVQDWVHEHAADYGLKFPMDYEPWHVEIQETRGGEPFAGTVATAGAVAGQQAVNDAVIGPGLKAWFQDQTDKTAAYLGFMNGTLELPMTLPDGRELTVNVRNSLSDKAFGEIEVDLRTQISFERQLSDERQQQDAKAAKERSDVTVTGYKLGLLFDGMELEAGGRKFVAHKPKPQDILQSLSDNDLTPTDAASLLEAIHAPPVARSDEDVKRQAFSMAIAGEDPTDFVVRNRASLTTEDAQGAVNFWKQRKADDGALTQRQKDYLTDIENLGAFAHGMLDKIDPDKQNRKNAASQEARERMLAGEDAREVFDDIEERSNVGPTIGGLSPSTILPRFSVPDPGNTQWIDPAGTAQAIETAKTDGRLSPEEYERALSQFRAFMTWQAGDADRLARRGKK